MYPDVMVDLETGSTDPEHGPILQIAAVRFNHMTGDVDFNDMFNACLLPPQNRYWAEDTVRWWSEQNPDVLASIIQRGEPAERVINRFFDWAQVYPDASFWSKPLSFDYPFVASYFRQFNLGNPFPFWKARDVRSFCAGVTFPNPPISDKDIPFEGNQHDAIFDVLHQIRYVFRVSEERRKGVVDA